MIFLFPIVIVLLAFVTVQIGAILPYANSNADCRRQGTAWCGKVIRFINLTRNVRCVQAVLFVPQSKLFFLRSGLATRHIQQRCCWMQQ